ncbi:polysaccharide deacetylase family protein [Tenuibacillus multivorans]|uniref:Peptidoglycan/xylan/chitin deacetylase, PgdA/CDA1 family n=1 Tax=Tenuibacillus multivorans TaxID=237069 RepID=A0A1G9WRG2_9BACI|nr:polysaccharide deacetylase family protein [Tenuibacillus multivorans]GEL77960.1 hypothetical protein TMU01_21950 [Tenuibacillus multivorans]SDM87027.1 Peptidoglycan/xylan/chitin deacetylase, PgdA/CDA1 family [Tenuibacillus multivorans]
MQYTFKLLELIQLHNGYAKVRLSFDQDEKLFWLKLDDETYQSMLESLNSFEQLIRLSLTSKRDPFTDSSSSTLTAIDGHQQWKIDFNCSEHYTNQIEQLKQAETFKHVENLSFIQLPENMTSNSEVDNPEEQSQDDQGGSEVETKEDTGQKWASIKVDEVVHQHKSTDWWKAIPIPKMFRRGLIVASVLALLLAFSNEHFFATESSDVDLNQETYLLSTDLDRHLQLVKDESIEVVQTSESEEPNFPMFKVEEELFYGLPQGYVALTFDDGPSPFTKEIADILSEHGVAGTFFFVGTQIEKYPDQVKYVEQQGHVIGSHSYGHQNLSLLAPGVLENDVLEAVTGLEGLVGHQVDLFRPPYGATDDEVIEVLSQNNLKTVMWNRDPRDWEAGKEEDIINYFKSVDPSGGIYILHENKHTLNALPEILAYLESQGLKVVGLH